MRTRLSPGRTYIGPCAPQTGLVAIPRLAPPHFLRSAPLRRTSKDLYYFSLSPPHLCFVPLRRTCILFIYFFFLSLIALRTDEISDEQIVRSAALVFFFSTPPSAALAGAGPISRLHRSVRATDRPCRDSTVRSAVLVFYFFFFSLFAQSSDEISRTNRTVRSAVLVFFFFFFSLFAQSSDEISRTNRLSVRSVPHLYFILFYFFSPSPPYMSLDLNFARTAIG